MQSRHWTTASWTSSTRSENVAGLRVDPQDRVVVDLRLEVLRPAAVAAQPGPRRRPELARRRRSGRSARGLCRASGSVTQPPIWLIVRGGWRKPGSETWCLSSLRQTASRIACSSSSSSAPSRSGSRRSVSCRLNRQVRSLPSAVRRMRLQSAQNGSETGLMKPISPRPSRKRQTLRGRVRARAATGSSGWTAVDHRADLGAGQHAVLRPGVVGVERHELDEAHLVGLAPRQLRERQHLVLGEAAHRDAVDLDRAELRDSARAPRAPRAPAAASRAASSGRSGPARASRARR